MNTPQQPAKLLELDIDLTDLVLDPNNPRFVQQTKETMFVSDEQAIQDAKQDQILRQFSPQAIDAESEEGAEPDTTSIQDLRDSLLRIGYVGIDKIVVRRIGKTGKFLVLEGNRRVATLKSLRRDYEAGTAPFQKAAKRSEYERHVESYQKLTVLELDTKGLSVADVQRAVSVILGIRHHGSLLSWEPVARAFNIYCEYKKLAGGDFTEISLNNTKAVAERLCILPGEVKQALRSYVAYLQLREAFGEDLRNVDFSLIETAVGNKTLRNSYLKVDENTYRLDPASLERLNRICQFGRRDTLPKPGGPKKIISDPKEIRRLAQIVLKRVQAKGESERVFVESVLTRIEDESDPYSVDDGLDDTIAHLAALNWRSAIADLLEEQKEKLNEEDFTGTGNERGHLEEAQRVLANIAKVVEA
ncbi:MAG: hypothetical protein FJ184_03065 [Gammaproteobacteria bacterium]|nr:hypothetical protein [Gammaproteobacteria bacterium]